MRYKGAVAPKVDQRACGTPVQAAMRVRTVDELADHAAR